MNNKCLFIVGASRSGTKLLRDLLNNHSKIGIPNIESQFIIDLLKINNNNPNKTRNIILKSTFIARLNSQIVVDWLKNLDLTLYNDDPKQIIIDLLKMSAENYTEGMYWGDKTPFYLRDIDLLKKGFPYAKFIHIIRDPRDRCLSVYKTWGKNLYRAASGWYSDVSQCRKYAKNFPHDYMEVFYEDLLKNPEEELRRCTKFLSLSFENEIVKLQSPSEKHGNTSKVSGIVSNNSNKVINELSSKKIKRLEEIVFPLFKQTPYNAYYANKYVPYSKFLNIVYKLVDYVSFRIAVYVKKY